jgi:hypothetical protein
MKLWHIVDGVPSVADGVLVSAAPVFCLGVFVRVLDPVLNYFEPRGLVYLGYALVFLAFGCLGGIGFAAFMANQKKMREEVRVPRVVFAFSAVPVVLVLHTAIVAWLVPTIVRRDLSLDSISNQVGLVLIAVFGVLYALVVKAALRFPTRTTAIAIWFNLALSALEVAAKAAALFHAK